MDGFTLNGDRWRVVMVDERDPALIDRTGHLRLATTDPDTLTVHMSDRLHGDMLARVLIHEIGHCLMVSYDLIGQLHRMVRPEKWVESEEWVCNFLADYGMLAFSNAARVMGNGALKVIPSAMERLIA